MTVDTYRIVLADHHILFRQELARILSEKEDLEIVGEEGDGLELQNLLDRLALNQLFPHLIILDPSMPNLPGVAAASQITLAYPGAKVLILTIHKDREMVNQALSHGAKGYLLKDEIETDLAQAIDMIRRGKVYVPSSHSSLANGLF